MNNRIKEKRLEKGMKQKELAEKSGVARSVISQLENGSRSVITSSTMVKLARALDTTIETLFLS